MSSYYVKRFGFQPKCQIIAFTGDNPGTLAVSFSDFYDSVFVVISLLIYSVTCWTSSSGR